MIEFEIEDVKSRSRFLTRYFKQVRVHFKQNIKTYRSGLTKYFNGIKYELNIPLYGVFLIKDEEIILIFKDGRIQLVMQSNPNKIFIKWSRLDNLIKNASIQSK